MINITASIIGIAIMFLLWEAYTRWKISKLRAGQKLSISLLGPLKNDPYAIVVEIKNGWVIYHMDYKNDLEEMPARKFAAIFSCPVKDEK